MLENAEDSTVTQELRSSMTFEIVDLSKNLLKFRENPTVLKSNDVEAFDAKNSVIIMRWIWKKKKKTIDDFQNSVTVKIQWFKKCDSVCGARFRIKSFNIYIYIYSSAKLNSILFNLLKSTIFASRYLQWVAVGRAFFPINSNLVDADCSVFQSNLR